MVRLHSATTFIQLLRYHDVINTLRPRQDGRHFADDSFTCVFFNENCCILIKFSLKYIRKGAIDNNRALVQIMAWRRSGDKPLSEPMMVRLPTDICVARPQWVNRQILDECRIHYEWLKKIMWISIIHHHHFQLLQIFSLSLNIMILIWIKKPKLWLLRMLLLIFFSGINTCNRKTIKQPTLYCPAFVMLLECYKLGLEG